MIRNKGRQLLEGDTEMNIPTTLSNPAILRRNLREEETVSIPTILFRERIVFLGSPIDDQVANSVVAQMLILAREDPTKPIRLYINSPGGQVYSGLAIYDTMQQIECPVSTVAVGFTASFGTVLLTAGTAGMRYALPNATIHLHQPLGGAQGQASDIAIQANEILRLRKSLNVILSHHTNQPIERIEEDTERDFFMTAEEARDYGLVDEVLTQSSNGEDE